MTDDKLKLPLYIKASVFVVGLCALTAILYIAKGIIVPVVFAVFIAIAIIQHDRSSKAHVFSPQITSLAFHR